MTNGTPILAIKCRLCIVYPRPWRHVHARFKRSHVAIMTTLKVALVGASGRTGQSIVNGLLEDTESKFVSYLWSVWIVTPTNSVLNIPIMLSGNIRARTTCINRQTLECRTLRIAVSKSCRQYSRDRRKNWQQFSLALTLWSPRLVSAVSRRRFLLQMPRNVRASSDLFPPAGPQSFPRLEWWLPVKCYVEAS